MNQANLSQGESQHYTFTPYTVFSTFSEGRATIPWNIIILKTMEKYTTVQSEWGEGGELCSPKLAQKKWHS